MNHSYFSHILKRAAALSLVFALSLPPVFASAGEPMLQTTLNIVDGLTYTNTITQQVTRRNESFSLLVTPDSEVKPILLQASGTVYGAATINRAVSYAQELGYHVLGAINTDYFSTATGVPMGIVVEDHVYKSSSSGHPAILIQDGCVSFSSSPAVELTLTNHSTDATITPNHLNKSRTATGGLYLLNQDFSTVSTRTTTPGWFVRMKLIPDASQNESQSLTVNSQLTLQVTEVLESDTALSIGENEYLLTADAVDGLNHIYESFQVGDTVTLTTRCEEEALSLAQWAGGVGDLMIENGQLTDPTNWQHNNNVRAPRSALGVMPDGSLLLYTIDGRQSGYSVGLTQQELADELLAQGCVWAVNLDGGGSTALSVWLPGQSGSSIQNLPSDGKARPCATYLLLVTEETGNKRPHSLTMTEHGLCVLTGSSLTLPEAVVLDNSLNLLEDVPSDLTISSINQLGEVEEGIYTAGDTAGTEILKLYSHHLGISGYVPVYVVDTLTELTITQADSEAPLNQIKLKPAETIALAAAGSYWNRPAMRDVNSILWSVDPAVGSVDQTGVFTAGKAGSTGDLVVTAGGMTQTIPVIVKNIHTDVDENHWAYAAVEYCYENGIVGGISPTEFGRDNPIRRGDFMLMLYNAMGKPAVTGECTFTDVSSTDYYAAALAWGQQVGLASGTGDGAYSPTNSLTREQAFTILRQALPLLGKSCPDADLSVLEQFSDFSSIADYAKPHAATLVAQGVVSGRGDGLDPRGNLTRAEMAALVSKILTYTPITEYPENPAEPEIPEVPAQPETPEDPQQPELPITPETPEDESTSQTPDLTDVLLTLDRTELTLNSGESFHLTAMLTPEVEGAVITWSSSSPSVATVTPSGVVTNLFPGVGTPTVTITASCGELTAECTVICSDAACTGVVTDAENGLNVRSGPGTDYTAIGFLPNEAQVIVLHEQDGWYQVLYLNDKQQAAIGYVSGNYLVTTP